MANWSGSSAGVDFGLEVALGKIPGYEMIERFGHNQDLDAAAEETIWDNGGRITYLTVGETLTIVSSSASDDGSPVGVGARTILIRGVNSLWEDTTEIVTLDGTTPVITTSTWLGVNNAIVLTSGTSKANVGSITITATTSTTAQAYIEPLESMNHAMVYHIPLGKRVSTHVLTYYAAKITGGANPIVTFRGILIAENGTEVNAFVDRLDTSVVSQAGVIDGPSSYVGEKTRLEVRASTTDNNTSVSARFHFLQWTV